MKENQTDQQVSENLKGPQNQNGQLNHSNESKSDNSSNKKPTMIENEENENSQKELKDKEHQHEYTVPVGAQDHKEEKSQRIISENSSVDSSKKETLSKSSL